MSCLHLLSSWSSFAANELPPVTSAAADAFMSSLDRKPWRGTRLVLARQRLASEADKSEAGDVGHLRTVGRPDEGPFWVVRLADDEHSGGPPSTA
jgi:hypothetical protein